MGNTKESLKLLKDMEHKCLFFNDGCNTVIRGFCCEGDSIGARRIFWDMGWDGLVYNIYSYNIVIDEVLLGEKFHVIKFFYWGIYNYLLVG